MENGTELNISTENINQIKQKTSGSSDEKAPDSSDIVVAKTKVLAKGKKRKKPKDSTAPRHPLTGTLKTSYICVKTNFMFILQVMSGI